MGRVVVAMSGGVDSAVAALLLKREGHEVIGLFMRTGEGSVSAHPADTRASHKKGCCSSLDAADARRVADKLDIPFYAVDFTAGFARIKDAFVAAYRSGRTPNPCVLCNNWLKFGELWRLGRELGADAVATGHHARLLPTATDGQGGAPLPRLLRATDAAKDQSYVLFGVPREMLPHLRFPVGAMNKNAVRELAQAAGLPVFAKPDSVDICFVPDGDAAGFVRRYGGVEPIAGPIVDEQGRRLGTHAGIEQFTIGQRKGLGVAAEGRRFVLALVPETATVVIGPREAGLRTHLQAHDANWLIPPPATPFQATVKIGYRDPASPATVIPRSAAEFTVEFSEPVFGVAPGQAAVVYAGEQVLGGGWIAATPYE